MKLIEQTAAVALAALLSGTSARAQTRPSVTPVLAAGSVSDATAPAADRVGFPEGYAESFTVLRTFNKPAEQQVVTVFGNTLAATVKTAGDLPFPNGSVLVMETSSARKGTDGKPVTTADGSFQRGEVVGLHVMRRGNGFGVAYGKNRSGEWEYAEYRGDRSYITPPSQTAACATCHVKAGEQRDFVYRGRLPGAGN